MSPVARLRFAALATGLTGAGGACRYAAAPASEGGPTAATPIAATPRAIDAGAHEATAGDSGPAAPVAVAIGASPTAFVACALRADHAVWCWDTKPCSLDGALGAAEPHRVGPAELRAVQIDIGNVFSCGRTGEGAVFCWDNDRIREQDVDATRIQLPEPASDLRLVPVLVAGGGTRAYVRGVGGIASWFSEDGLPPASAGKRMAIKEIPNVVGGGDAGCERDSGGGVRCHGTSAQESMRAGMPHAEPLVESDSQWRAVPALFGAHDLGANDSCGWGFVGERVREDCVFGPGAEGQTACVAGSARCTGWTKSRYISEGVTFRREAVDYRFPGIKRLVTFDVGLDESGRCVYFDGHALAQTGPSKYRDMVGERRAFTGLTSNGEVRQFCSEYPTDAFVPVFLR